MPPKKATAPKHSGTRTRQSRVPEPSRSSREESSQGGGIRAANTSEGKQLDQALEANRKLQEELYQLFFQLEDQKVRCFVRICYGFI